MKAAVMGYCLRGALPAQEQTMSGILQLAASEGIHTVELYAGGWDVGGDIRKTSESVRQEANHLGIDLPVMGSGTRLGHLGKEREANMAVLKQEVEACAILGGTVMTLPIVDGQPIAPDQPKAKVGVRFERMLPELVSQLQELADHAAKFNVELAVLNHCFLVYLSWHQKWLSVFSERANVGACIDPGNYLHYGHQDPVGACKELAGYAKMARAGGVARVADDEIKLKFKEKGDFQPWTAVLFDQGDIDQKACYQALADGGFRGYVSLKSAGQMPDGPLAAIRHSWKALNQTLLQVSA